MKITFVLPGLNLSGGIRVIATYAERLTARGHDVFVVTPPPHPVSLRRKIKLLISGTWWPLRLEQPSASHFDGKNVPVHVLQSYREVADNDVPDADVVIATFWATGHAVARLSPRKGAKAIFLQGYEMIPGNYSEEIDAVWRLPIHKITISRWLVDLARTRFGDTDVSHVPNSVDTLLFHAPKRERHSVPTVGFLYATPDSKGCHIALAAIERIRERLKNLRVVAFGTAPPSRKMKLPDNTTFYLRPPQHTLRSIYAECDVWLCSSRAEGFHLPPLEAMACRCPVVSTRVGGPMDIVEDGKNGFLVDIDDVDGLAEKAIHVLTIDPLEWQRLSDAALSTAIRYSWDDATTLFDEALRKLLRSSRSDAA